MVTGSTDGCLNSTQTVEIDDSTSDDDEDSTDDDWDTNELVTQV